MRVKFMTRARRSLWRSIWVPACALFDQRWLESECQLLMAVRGQDVLPLIYMRVELTLRHAGQVLIPVCDVFFCDSTAE